MKHKRLLSLLFIALLVISAYFSFRNLLESSFRNTQWILMDGIDIDTTHSEVEITLSFEAGNQISGYTGVNQYGGSYHIRLNNQIEITQLYSTLIASTDEIINKNERQFLNLLMLSKTYEITSEALLLLDNQQQVLLKFKRSD